MFFKWYHTSATFQVILQFEMLKYLHKVQWMGLFLAEHKSSVKEYLMQATIFF